MLRQVKLGAAIAPILEREGLEVILYPRIAALAEAAGIRTIAIGRGIEPKGEDVPAMLESITARETRASRLQREKEDTRC